MLYSELQPILNSYTSVLLGKYPHRYLNFDLTAKYNATLRLMLLNDGYWDWAPGRSNQLVSYHQIVAFYCTKHPKTGGDSVQVHHIDGNTINNHPTNLMYLSPGDHALVTKYQRKLSKLNLKTFYRLHSSMAHTTFNRRGKTIHNWGRFILSVIALTVSKTQTWCKTFLDNASSALMTPIKTLISNIQRTLRSYTQPALC
jgi:hypothetical protein